MTYPINRHYYSLGLTDVHVRHLFNASVIYRLQWHPCNSHVMKSYRYSHDLCVTRVPYCVYSEVHCTILYAIALVYWCTPARQRPMGYPYGFHMTNGPHVRSVNPTLMVTSWRFVLLGCPSQLILQRRFSFDSTCQVGPLYSISFPVVVDEPPGLSTS